MIIPVSDANAKLDKLSRDPTTLLFALSPEGFLLVKKAKISRSATTVCFSMAIIAAEMD